MTTVTTITAATPGNGITGPTQGAGNAAAGFEALLAAFFGEATAVAPTQGAGLAPAPSPAAPMIMNGEAVLADDAALAQPQVQAVQAPLAAPATQAAELVLSPDLALLADVVAIVAPATPQAIVETAIEAVADAAAPLFAKSDPAVKADEDQDAQPTEGADKTLVADASLIVAPLATPVPVVQTPATEAAKAVSAEATPKTVPAAQPAVAAQTTVAPETAAPPSADAVAAAATGEAVAAAATEAAPHAAPQTQPKSKPAPAAAPVRTSAPAHVDNKAQVSAPAADVEPVEAEPLASMTPEAPATADAQVAKTDAPAMSEHHKAATAQARAPQGQPAQAAPVPTAPAVEADLTEALPAAAMASAIDATTTETAPEQAAPALTGAAGEVATAAAGRTAVAAARPRDTKDAAKTEPQKVDGKADAEDIFRAVASDVRKAAPATMAAKQADKAEAATAKEPEVEAAKTSPTAARVEDAQGHVAAEDRPADLNRASNAAPHTQHPVRGSPETVANFAAQIVKKLNAKATRFDIELTPGGMGTVDVRIEIQNGRVTAAMTFDNPQAAAELKARAAELQRSLEQAGFDLSNGGLSFEAKDGGDAGRGWRQAQDQNDGRGMRGKAFQNAFDTANEAADIAESGALRLRRGVTSGLDVRV